MLEKECVRSGVECPRLDDFVPYPSVNVCSFATTSVVVWLLIEKIGRLGAGKRLDGSPSDSICRWLVGQVTPDTDHTEHHCRTQVSV